MQRFIRHVTKFKHNKVSLSLSKNSSIHAIIKQEHSDARELWTTFKNTNKKASIYAIIKIRVSQRDRWITLGFCRCGK
jgi:hypothetical protein